MVARARWLLAGFASARRAQDRVAAGRRFGRVAVRPTRLRDAHHRLPQHAMVVQNRMIKLIGKQNVKCARTGRTFSIVGGYREGATFTGSQSDELVQTAALRRPAGWCMLRLQGVRRHVDLQFRPNPSLPCAPASSALTGYAGATAFDRKSNCGAGGRLA